MYGAERQDRASGLQLQSHLRLYFTYYSRISILKSVVLSARTKTFVEERAKKFRQKIRLLLILKNAVYLKLSYDASVNRLFIFYFFITSKQQLQHKHCRHKATSIVNTVVNTTNQGYNIQTKDVICIIGLHCNEVSGTAVFIRPVV